MCINMSDGQPTTLITQLVLNGALFLAAGNARL